MRSQATSGGRRWRARDGDLEMYGREIFTEGTKYRRVHDLGWMIDSAGNESEPSYCVPQGDNARGRPGPSLWDGRQLCHKAASGRLVLASLNLPPKDCS